MGYSKKQMNYMRTEYEMRFCLSIIILAIMSIFSIASCGKPSEEKAYEEVISTMSIEKAKQFFMYYPQGKYRDRLVNELIGWCKQEETAVCYKMILEAIPKDHPKYKDTLVYYEKHSEEKK